MPTVYIFYPLLFYIVFSAGAVTMTGLEDPVKYNSKHNITCSTLNLDVIPMWWHNQFNKITNGSESRITVNDGSGTIKSWSLSLFKITELWAGMFVSEAWFYFLMAKSVCF